MEHKKWKAWYEGYLRSEEWRRKKMEALYLARYKCQDCGADYENVHHLAYDRVGYEDMKDLVVLCKRCHEVRHGISSTENGVDVVGENLEPGPVMGGISSEPVMVKMPGGGALPLLYTLSKGGVFPPPSKGFVFVSTERQSGAVSGIHLRKQPEEWDWMDGLPFSWFYVSEPNSFSIRSAITSKAKELSKWEASRKKYFPDDWFHYVLEGCRAYDCELYLYGSFDAAAAVNCRLIIEDVCGYARMGYEKFLDEIRGHSLQKFRGATTRAERFGLPKFYFKDIFKTDTPNRKYRSWVFRLANESRNMVRGSDPGDPELRKIVSTLSDAWKTSTTEVLDIIFEEEKWLDSCDAKY